jgi:membrane protein implicated in regulation of membrane protease activity
MRGGAIPILAWGTILLVLAIGNWIWDAKPVNAGVASAAVAIVYVFGVAQWLSRREAIRRGPPEPRHELDSVPQASLAAAGIGVSLGCILFGIAWARFLVAFGAGVLVLSLGRLVLEIRAERHSRVDALGREARK